MIKVQNLFHSYTNDENYAVNDISFELKKGEIFGFLGPNGAGKSTTQKILTGLMPLQKGKVTLAGIDIKQPTKDLYNMIGVAFEHPNIYKKLSGYENLNFYSKMYSVPTEDPKKVLSLVDLLEAMHNKAGNYSKGMKQRLVLARSLINKPAIWFLDEPISGLDPATAQAIKDLIKRKKDEGTTIFLTTHNMFVAEQICDRVAFINDGKIEVIDSPKNLKLKFGQKKAKLEYKKNGKIIEESFSVEDELQKQRLSERIRNEEIITIHTQEATLEEIFIKLTGKGLS
ncbi:MAG: ABC transporter ATP-binding protein [Halanaerobiales bacterium]|nr:ABC transporter ATP-binding protein [Halanaerobiales bacterium]